MSTITTDPYRPPAASLELDEPRELKQTSVVFMIVATIATLGLYGFYWVLSRRRALNQMAPEGERIDTLCFTWIAANLVVLGVSFYAGVVASPEIELVANLISLASNIIGIVLAFHIKFILEANSSDDFSAVGTFFLTLYYLQFKINRLQPADAVANRFTLG